MRSQSLPTPNSVVDPVRSSSTEIWPSPPPHATYREPSAAAAPPSLGSTTLLDGRMTRAAWPGAALASSTSSAATTATTGGASLMRPSLTRRGYERPPRGGRPRGRGGRRRGGVGTETAVTVGGSARGTGAGPLAG